MLGAIFDEDAQLYDRARPGYPADLFSDLGTLAGIGPGSRVAEIGPGTGQATRGLVAAGADVVCVERGAALAWVLRRNLPQPNVEIVRSRFEDWPLPADLFDTVVAFTAWHWLDPSVRAAKAAAVLRPGGALATITTVHVSDGSNGFFDDVQECYEQWNPTTTPGSSPPAADDVPPILDEVDESGLFMPGVRRRYQQDTAYRTDEYLAVLGTYSGHRAMKPAAQRGLFGCVARLIDNRYGGRITKRYVYELRVARRPQA